MDATYIYGIGFSPHPCVIEITSGIATAAVAVFEGTSDNSSVAVRMIRIVTKPPFISREEITSPSAFATPVALIRLPSARPPANIYIRSQTIFPCTCFQTMIRFPSLFVKRKAMIAQMINTYAGFNPGNIS